MLEADSSNQFAPDLRVLPVLCEPYKPQIHNYGEYCDTRIMFLNSIEARYPEVSCFSAQLEQAGNSFIGSLMKVENRKDAEIYPEKYETTRATFFRALNYEVTLAQHNMITRLAPYFTNNINENNSYLSLEEALQLSYLQLELLRLNLEDRLIKRMDFKERAFFVETKCLQTFYQNVYLHNPDLFLETLSKVEIIHPSENTSHSMNARVRISGIDVNGNSRIYNVLLRAAQKEQREGYYDIEDEDDSMELTKFFGEDSNVLRQVDNLRLFINKLRHQYPGIKSEGGMLVLLPFNPNVQAEHSGENIRPLELLSS